MSKLELKPIKNIINVDDINEIINDNENAKYTIKELIKANETLSQENKQLKEEIEEYKRIEQEDLKAFNNYDSILTELEEWLKEETKLCDDYLIGECHTDYTDVLDKIQELRNKYEK